MYSPYVPSRFLLSILYSFSDILLSLVVRVCLVYFLRVCVFILYLELCCVLKKKRS